jgi:ankyrin repeat protein
MEVFIECMKGDINNVDPLKVYTSDYDGNTASHLCAIYRKYSTLFRLLKKYPRLTEYLNDAGKSAIHLIEDCGPLNRCIDLYLGVGRSAELDVVPYDGETLLIKVIGKCESNIGYIPIVTKLLSSNIRLDIPSGNPPLIHSIEIGSQIRVPTLLLENGANPNLKNKYGMSALIMAILGGSSTGVVKLLLDYNADINYSGPDGKFLPLNISLKLGYTNISDLLIGYNPNLLQQDNNLNTPAHHAIQVGSNTSRKTMEYILKYSDLNIQNIGGNTPFHLISKLGMWDQYRGILKNKDIDMGIMNREGESPTSYMNARELIQVVNSISNGTLKNRISDVCRTSVDYRCIEVLRSTIKEGLLDGSNRANIDKNIGIDMSMYPLREPDLNCGVFGTNVLHNVIYLVCILKRYSNAFIPFQYFIPEKSINDIMMMQNMNLFRTKYGKVLHNIVGIYTEYLFEMSPCIVIWHSKYVNYCDRNIDIYIRKLLNSGKIRFIVIKLTIIPLTSINHANIVIYDRRKNLVERFEPYGPLNYYVKDISELDLYIHNIFKRCINNDVAYRAPRDYMANAKFQVISSESDPINKRICDPNGFCLAWCYWFLELKLKNPDCDTGELIEGALAEMIDNDGVSANNVLSAIRGYAEKLDEMKNKFLISAGLDQSELYNVGYTGGKLSLLLDKILGEVNNMILMRVS